MVEHTQKLNLDSKTIWLFFIGNFLKLFVTLPLVLGFALIWWTAKFQNQINGLDKLGDVTMFTPSNIILIYFLFTAILSYLLAKLTYANWKYEITKDALRIEKGIIWKKYVSIPYEKIQNVDILRGVFARLLRLSDVQVQTAGLSGVALMEGRLPGLDIMVAEQVRDDLIKRSKGKSGV